MKSAKASLGPTN